MLARDRFGFHSVVRQGLSSCVALELSGRALAHQVHRVADGSILSDHLPLNLTATPSPVPRRACERAQTMSQLSKVKHSRNHWKAKAQQRSDDNRYLRKQLARVKAARDRAKPALKDTQVRFRQLESQAPTVAVRPKVDVVWLSLRLFLEVRISFRAVARVLHVLAAALGIERAPCAQSVINWGTRLSMVRIECARELRGLPLPHAPFSNGLIWMSDLSSALGSGKIVAVLALDAHHHNLWAGARSLAHTPCIAVSVADSWTGEAIAAGLKRLIAQMGRPAASLNDAGSELHKAVDLLDGLRLHSPRIDDLSPAAANMLKRYYQNHPAFERFVSAGGRVSGKLKQTLLACVAPPTVRTKARLMKVHRLFSWAEQLLQLSPAGGAKAGSILARRRAALAELPTCQDLIKRFRGDAQGLLACQQILKTRGLCHDPLAQGAPLIDAMPTAPVRQEFHASLEVQLETAKSLGLDNVGLPISSDAIESLLGVAKRHGVGHTQDAARIALRLPAFCGAPTREEAPEVLAVRVARQRQLTAEFPSLSKQRREVLGYPERLESLSRSQGSAHVELLPSPKKRSTHEAIATISPGCENPGGPQWGCRNDLVLIENTGPPDMREAALTS